MKEETFPSNEIPKFDLVLERDYVLIKGGSDHEIVKAGRYQLEYSGNPTDGGIGRWVRIKGTELGASEEFFLTESKKPGSGIKLEEVG